MEQIEITLRQRPSDYVIQVGSDNSYEIVIPETHHDIDLTIWNLADRLGIYGDELLPLIFHLTEDEIEVFLNVSLLDASFLHSLDSFLIREIDPKTLATLGKSGVDEFALIQSVIPILETTYVNPQSAEIELVTSVGTTLNISADLDTATIPLKSSINMTDQTMISLNRSTMSLITQVVEDIRRQVFLVLTQRGIHWFDGMLHAYDDMYLSEMDSYYPKMSLVQSQGSVYMRFSFSTESFDMELQSEINDFLSNVAVFVQQAVMHLNSGTTTVTNNASADLEQIVMGLQNNMQIVVPFSVCGTTAISTTFRNWMSQGTRLTTACYADNYMPISTLMNDDIELWHGLDFYDDDLLMTWDDWTLYDMAEAARIA